jgi:hypothetical protein
MAPELELQKAAWSVEQIFGKLICMQACQSLQVLDSPIAPELELSKAAWSVEQIFGKLVCL